MPSPRLPTRYLALLGAAVLALYLCWQMVLPFIDVVLWAAVLAIVSYPLHARLLARTGRANLSAAITCVVVILVVLVPIGLVSVAVYRQARSSITSFPDAVAHFKESGLARKLDPYLNREEVLQPAFIREKLDDVVREFSGRIFKVIGGVLGIVAQIFFTLFALFYFLRDGPRIVRAIYDFVPLDHDQADLIFRRAHDVISASVFGVLVIAVVQGTLGGIAFAILGLNSPVLWGFIMFLLSMIPMAGSAIIWAPAAIFLIATHHWGKGVILIVIGAGVIGTIDNVLRPRLVGGRTRLHELVVFFSVIGGLQVFGVLGIIAGPVLVAVTLALLDVLRRAEPAAAATVPAHQVMIPTAPSAAEEARPAASQPISPS